MTFKDTIPEITYWRQFEQQAKWEGIPEDEIPLYVYEKMERVIGQLRKMILNQMLKND